MVDLTFALNSLAKLRTGPPTIADLRLGALERPLSSAEQISDRIEEDIISGEIPYGTWLREAQLSERFGLSRGPIREALRILETDGLIKIHKNRGAVVPTPTVTELKQIELLSAAIALPITQRLCETLAPELEEELLLTARFMQENVRYYSSTAISYHIAVYTLALARAACGEIVERQVRHLFRPTLKFTALGCGENSRKISAASSISHQIELILNRDHVAASLAYVNLMSELHEAGWVQHYRSAQTKTCK